MGTCTSTESAGDNVATAGRSNKRPAAAATDFAPFANPFSVNAEGHEPDGAVRLATNPEAPSTTRNAAAQQPQPIHPDTLLDSAPLWESPAGIDVVTASVTTANTTGNTMTRTSTSTAAVTSNSATQPESASATSGQTQLHHARHQLLAPGVAAPNAAANLAPPPLPPRRRHRSVSTVIGCPGYVVAAPSSTDHLSRLRRLGRIAGIHGITPDLAQFTPDQPGDDVLRRAVDVSLSWLPSVVDHSASSPSATLSASARTTHSSPP